MPAHASTSPPALVLSLDFELRWGVYDRLGDDPQAYRAHLDGVREVVPELLGALSADGVRATWACVGAMACEGWDDYLARAPEPPQWGEPSLRFDLRWADRDPDGALHFAPELVTRVAQTPGQEVGSHTFGHLCFGELGLVAADVARDAEACAEVLRARTGYTPRALVFPRNQGGFERELAAAGITTTRSSAPGWWWRRNLGREQVLPVRAARLASAFAPQRAAVDPAPRPAHVPATAFIRFNLPPALWALSCRQLAAQAAALGPGEVVHIWCHPHNLGDAPARRVAQLMDLVEQLSEAAPHARWMTMSEAGDQDGDRPSA